MTSSHALNRCIGAVSPSASAARRLTVKMSLVTCCTDNTARVWNLATGELVAPPLRHRGTVRDAAFSPDATKVVTASNDRTARVWETESGEPITPGLRHPQPVEEASFSEDGSQVTTRGADRVEKGAGRATTYVERHGASNPAADRTRLLGSLAAMGL